MPDGTGGENNKITVKIDGLLVAHMWTNNSIMSKTHTMCLSAAKNSANITTNISSKNIFLSHNARPRNITQRGAKV